jgi:hypothetical protein
MSSEEVVEQRKAKASSLYRFRSNGFTWSRDTINKAPLQQRHIEIINKETKQHGRVHKACQIVGQRDLRPDT